MNLRIAPPPGTRLRASLDRAKQRNLPRIIRTALDQYDLPREFFFVPLQESGYDATQVGPSTRLGYAKGMWQFIPDTAARYGLTVGPLAGREWNLTDKSAKWTSNVTLGAQYVFDWKETIAIGGGGAFNVTDTGDLKLAVDAIVAGPKIPINNNELRPALVGMYTAADGKKIAFVGATLSLDF